MEPSEIQSKESKSGQSSMLLIGALAIVIIGGYYFFVRKPATTMTASPSPADMSEESNEPFVDESPLPSSTPLETTLDQSTPSATPGPVKEIKITGANYKFNPATITVKKGTTVKVTLTSNDMPHDFMIDELGVKSDRVSKGETTAVTFTADKVGSFQYYCSVGNHRAMGMIGTLKVTQ